MYTHIIEYFDKHSHIGTRYYEKNIDKFNNSELYDPYQFDKNTIKSVSKFNSV